VRADPRHPQRWATVFLAAGVIGSSGAVGCSRDAHDGANTTPSSAPSSSAHGDPGPTPPGAVGLSPAGVTTRVDVPANSTEEEYYQACHAAKVWMEAQPTAGGSAFEPYLAMVQADLNLARQAAVITAAHAAANEECG
jgi:hypothetical protein